MAEDKLIAEGRHLRLLDRGGWELVERKKASGVVAIVAITADAKLVLTEQHRPAVQRPVIDLPAGLAGDILGEEHEPLSRAAERELTEEVGYRAAHMRPLAEATPSPGLSSEVVSFFLAEGLTRVSAGGGDAHEAITVHEVALAALPTWLADQERRGALVDLKLYAGLYLSASRAP